MEKKSLLLILMLMFVAIAGFITISGTVNGKSLYVITDINAYQNIPINAYDIQSPPNYLVYQTTDYIPDRDGGAVGLDIDSNSGYLFATFEFSEWIDLIDGTTMTRIDMIEAPNAQNLAGIAVDEGTNIVYAVDRYTDVLYAYDWNPSSSPPSLTLKSGYPINLPNANGLFGIALDETNDLLYVADYYANSYNGLVRYYDLATWTEQGNFQLSHSPIGIAIDIPNQFIYTVSGWGGSNILSKYDLTTQTETTTNMGHGGMGVTVDPSTGLVYVTGGYSGDDLSVWDTTTTPFTQLHTTGYLGGDPTGLCIPSEEISYNPLNLSKIDDVPNGDCIGPGNTIEYTITYDNIINANDVNNVIITDTLPNEVTYLSSSPTPDNINGQIVTWNIGTLAAGSGPFTISLQVAVNTGIPGGTIIHNSVIIDSDETPPTTQGEDTEVCDNQPPDPDPGIDPYVQDEGSPVLFDGSGSTDPDGDPLQFRWDFDNDGIWDTSWSNSPYASYMWCDDYTGNVVLEVTDGYFYITDTTTVIINNVAPSVDGGPNVILYAGQPFDQIGNILDPGCDTWNVMVNWDDGSPGSGFINIPNHDFPMHHIYTDVGDYEIVIRVTDDDGGYGTDTVLVSVLCIPEVWVDDGWYSQKHVNQYDPSLTWQVDAFNSIQDGINAVCEYGTVHVLNGVYMGYEDINVNKIGILIHGINEPPLDVNSRTAAIIKGMSMIISANMISIEQFAFEPTPDVPSITIDSMVDAETIMIHHNKFMRGCMDDAIGIDNLGENAVDARFNWWGSMDGPMSSMVDPVTGRPADGYGAQILDHGDVCFDPWAGLDADAQIQQYGRLIIYNGLESFACHLDGSNNEIVEYLWDFGDGSSSNKATGSHYYREAGEYTVTLRVRAFDPDLHVGDMFDWQEFTVSIRK